VQLKATRVKVPGDPSSAAFLIAAALIVPGSDIVIENVMMNPSRTGLFETLIEMGGDIRADNFKTSGGEIIADLRVRCSKLKGIVVPPRRAASMIDEYPILAVVAGFARGQTVMDGIEELRVKESDRIAATVALLRAGGVEVSETQSSMTVMGASSAAGGGHVITHHDHRIAMSALILGLGTDAPMSIDDSAMIATSFPTFFALMRELGADITGEAS
jgi:3-phosphoshikimate 1-carboxyvinyltransferase